MLNHIFIDSLNDCTAEGDGCNVALKIKWVVDFLMNNAEMLIWLLMDVICGILIVKLPVIKIKTC